MTPTQVKAAVKKVIEQYLYAKPSRYYHQQLNEIIIKDAIARRDGFRCFTHKGKNYKILNEKVACRVYPRLTRENREAMDKFLATWGSIFEDEKPRISSYIAHVLNSSDDPNVYLRLFPAQLRGCLKGLYEIYAISVDDLEFEDGKPADPVWANTYDLLCTRLTTNLLLE